MPFLFDGYNVYHAACRFSEELSHITPLTLCGFIAEDMRRLNDHAVVVFDGTQPRGRADGVEPAGFVRIVYSGPGADADSSVEKLIRKNTAPRRLCVVSSDNRLRRAARRRRAMSLTAAEYLEQMAKRAQQTPRAPAEPKEKRQGVPEGQLDEWLELFGIDPGAAAAEAE